MEVASACCSLAESGTGSDILIFVGVLGSAVVEVSMAVEVKRLFLGELH